MLYDMHYGMPLPAEIKMLTKARTIRVERARDMDFPKTNVYCLLAGRRGQYWRHAIFAKASLDRQKSDASRFDKDRFHRFQLTPYLCVAINKANPTTKIPSGEGYLTY